MTDLTKSPSTLIKFFLDGGKTTDVEGGKEYYIKYSTSKSKKKHLKYFNNFFNRNAMFYNKYDKRK